MAKLRLGVFFYKEIAWVWRWGFVGVGGSIYWPQLGAVDARPQFHNVPSERLTFDTQAELSVFHFLSSRQHCYPQDLPAFLLRHTDTEVDPATAEDVYRLINYDIFGILSGERDDLDLTTA